MKVYQPRRGGSWYYHARFACASNRYRRTASNSSGYDGFRCALIVWRRR